MKRTCPACHLDTRPTSKALPGGRLSRMPSRYAADIQSPSRRPGDFWFWVTLGRRASATCEVAGPSASWGAYGDGHGFHAGAGGRSALRRPAGRLLQQARVAGLAAPAVVRGVAGVRDAAANAGAWRHADHGQ